MPVVNFHVTWPDDSQSKCYSPSQVIKEHLEEGKEYALNEFMTRVTTALNLASERVRAKYGFACSSAQDQLEVLQNYAAKYADLNNPIVKVTKFTQSDIYS
jgi:uncharacterized repeat protein (TIGR04042 family)